MVTSTYVCEAKGCESVNVMDLAALRVHMREKHGIDTSNDRASRQGVLFIDGSNFFENRFRYTFESGVSILLITRFDRAKNDPMRMGE